MFEKVSQSAEKLAITTSRREFLGSVGRGAMAAATAAGGLLALPAVAAAARRAEWCSPTRSSYLCTNSVIGGACGNGKCTPYKGTVNDCYCRDPGNPGR